MGKPAKLPIILADTSVLVNLAKAQMYNDFRVPPTEQTMAAQDLRSILDRLTRDHTLIVTREVFRETFATDGGRLDMYQENGKPAIPLHRHKLLTHPDALLLYNVLSNYVQEGKLRCYNSPAEMFAAGEIDAPKGGIVVVDNGVRLHYESTDGEMIGNKADLFQQHLKSLEGDAPSAGNGKFRDAGEISLFNLAKEIQQYTTKKGTAQRYLIGADDGWVHGAVRKYYPGCVKPLVVHTYQLPWALSQDPSDPQPVTAGTADALTKALELERTHSGFQGKLIPEPEECWRTTLEVADWLRQKAPPRAGGRQSLGGQTARLEGSAGTGLTPVR